MAKHKLKTETRKALAAQLPKVKPGQTWVDNRRTVHARELLVRGLVKGERGKKNPVWSCLVLKDGTNIGRIAKIRQSSFTSRSGYRLKEAGEKNLFHKPTRREALMEKLEKAVASTPTDTEATRWEWSDEATVPPLDHAQTNPAVLGDGKTYDNITVRAVGVEVEVPVLDETGDRRFWAIPQGQTHAVTGEADGSEEPDPFAEVDAKPPEPKPS